MRKEIFYGIIAGLLLLLAYTLLLYSLNGPEHLLEQFNQYGFLILLLAAGFGIQVGLFFFARTELRNKEANKQMAATSGVSAGSMVMCCLHHVTDVLPFLGLSGAFLLASEYTLFFLAIGLLSNLIGITMMLSILQKHDVFPFQSMANWKWLDIRNLSVAASVVAVAALASVFWLLPAPMVSAQSPNGALSGLAIQSDSQATIQVDVTPQISASQTAFSIQLTTHSGSMDFSVEQIASLSDSTGKTYFPIQWDGSPPGGHHRSGTLLFGPVSPGAQTITLSLKGIGGIDRVFSWNLN